MSDFGYIPDGFHSVTPSLTFKDAPAAMAFYKEAFGAEERFILPGKDPSQVLHAEISIGNSTVMLSSEFPDMGAIAPEIGTGGRFMVYVEDCDAAYQRALDAGATSLSEPEDMFWGDRTAGLQDPHGYRWTVAQKVRDVPPEELEEASKQWTESL